MPLFCPGGGAPSDGQGGRARDFAGPDVLAGAGGAVGCAVGATVGGGVGGGVGTVGCAVGCAVGCGAVGGAVGCGCGCCGGGVGTVGCAVGCGVGGTVGLAVGLAVGVSVGVAEDAGSVGRAAGAAVSVGVVGGAVGLAIKGVDVATATLVGEGSTDGDGAALGLAEACGWAGDGKAGCGVSDDDAVGAGLDTTATSGLWPGTPDAAARRWSSTPPRPNATDTSTRFTAPSARTRRTRWLEVKTIRALLA